MKILIIGLGSIAKKHILAIRAVNKKSKIYALRSGKGVLESNDVVSIYDWRQLKDYVFDFAIISNPTSKHYQAISKLLEYKIPLFIEKPLFSKLEGEDLIDKIKLDNIPTYVACNLRFLNSLQFIKKHLEGKRINEVNIYCGSYLPDWRPGRDYKATYSANENEGGGVHIDLIHEIDYAYWLFGKPKLIDKTFSRKSSLNINAYDYANYTLGYDDYNVSVILNYYRRDPKRTLELVLDDETVQVDLLNNTVIKGAEIIFESDKNINDTYIDQMSFFVNEIIENNVIFNSIEEAYEILNICLQSD